MFKSQGLRFIQTSDNFVEGDGFVFDDFTITGFPNGMMGDFNLDSSVDIFDLLGIADVLILGKIHLIVNFFYAI